MIAAPIPLPRLDGAGVTYGLPQELSTTSCDRCGMLACRAVADVSWPNPEVSGGQDWVTVGRGCLADAVALALEETGDATATVAVDVPVWRASDIVAHEELSYRQLDHWVRRGWLFPEPGTGRRGSGSGPGYARLFLTDEVVMARQMAGLAELGLAPDAARVLLDGHPDVAANLHRALSARERIAA